MKKILILITILNSCASKNSQTYTLHVNYTNTVTTSDTVIVTSSGKPKLWIDRGLSCLIVNDSVVATNVRSFKILSVK